MRYYWQVRPFTIGLLFLLGALACTDNGNSGSGFGADSGTGSDADADADADGDTDADKESDTDANGDTDPDTEVFSDTGSDSEKGCGNECQGVCLDQDCCPFDQVCGNLCCGLGEVCFANACVVPGEICHSAADCEEGEYCESALGEEETDESTDAGVGEGDQICLADAPEAGRCLKLPVTCQPGEDPISDECLETCEYHPETGPLDAVVKWYWGTNARELPNRIDIWSTPAVGRAYDTNCDGVIDDLDPPVIFVIAGSSKGTCCQCDGNVCSDETLRAIDGATGKELWTLDKPNPKSKGFAGMSVALADIDDDAVLDIITASGEGRVVMVDAKGFVKATSDKTIEKFDNASFGWGGGFAVADMNGDTHPEIAFGRQVFTTIDNKIRQLFIGKGRAGGETPSRPLSTFVDLDGAKDGHLELLAGPTAYKYDGSILWDNEQVPEGYPGVGDFDNKGDPEVVVVTKGQVYLLEAKTGKILMGPLAIGTGIGGPPTVADFDGDGFVEIGVAQEKYYYVVKPNYEKEQLEILWQTRNHDFSSSVTGSTVFDFEGDGAAEVVYNDECFLWVYDGKTGEVKFATPTTSFTGTEASLVADIDGDGRAELLMIANGVSPTRWKCDTEPWNTLVEPSKEWDPENPPHPAWEPPKDQTAHRGLWAFGSKSNSWVGTRTLWNQHTYHVTNICDHRDNACEPPNIYGTIPMRERNNWEVSWLNNFRQNVQDSGMFNAPDVTLSLRVECWPDLELIATVQNRGQAILPAGVEIGFFVETPATELLGSIKTQSQIFPGQSVELTYAVDGTAGVVATDLFVARVITDPLNVLFHECREDNNASEPATCPGSGVL